jgi:hypothetical protein
VCGHNQVWRDCEPPVVGNADSRRGGGSLTCAQQILAAAKAGTGSRTFRGDKQQVTIRATLTDSTPGIVAALIADPPHRRRIAKTITRSA